MIVKFNLIRIKLIFILILLKLSFLNPAYWKIHEIVKTFHHQHYDAERKIKEFCDIDQKWSTVNTCFDKLLKLKDTYATSSTTTIVV